MYLLFFFSLNNFILFSAVFVSVVKKKKKNEAGEEGDSYDGLVFAY